MAPRGETRRRMVSTTVKLLRRRGLHGTGIQEVLAESAAPRGSLYFHFPGGKEQLVEEAIETAGRRGDRWMLRCLEESATVGDAVARMLEEYAVLLEATEFGEGCPVAAVALDLGPDRGPVRAACGRALDGWVALLAEALRTEGAPGHEARARAETAMAAFEGALLISRARRDVAPLRAVAGQVRRLLGADVTDRDSAT